MSMMIEHPGWAWLAAAVVAALAVMAVMGRRDRRRGRRSWRWVAAGVILPWAAAACVALAMAGISVELRDDAGVIILLDFSASTRGSPWRDPAWVRGLAQRRLGRERPVSVVGFGGGGDSGTPRVLVKSARPGQDSAWPVAWPAEATAALEAESARLAKTGVAAALAWRSPGERDGGGTERAARWVITDGLFSPQAVRGAGNAGPLAWTIVPPGHVDVGVTDMVVRNALGSTSGAAGIEILAQLRAVAPAGSAAEDRGAARVVQAVVEITRDGAPIASEPVAFDFSGGQDGQGIADRTRWISARDELDSTAQNVPHRYAVRVTMAAGGGSAAGHDLWPENDAGSVVWAAPEKMRVLVVGDGLPGGLSAGETSGWVLGRADPQQFGGDVRELAAGGWQVIVLNDVPAETQGNARRALSPAAARGIDHFVREMGGGLLILSDGHAFGPGRYGEGSVAGDILEGLSPFWSHPHRGASLSVVFVIDASASMNETVGGGSGGTGIAERKFRMLAGGMTRAAGLLSEDDRLAVIAFNDRARTLVSGSVREVRSSLPQILAGVQPAGATVPDMALAPLAGALRDEQSRLAGRQLVIFVTDGEIPAMDVARWKELLSPGAGNVGPAELCLVAPQGAAGSLIARLASTVPGTRWFRTEDAGAWGGLLHQTVAEEVRGRLVASPVEWQYQTAAGGGEGTLLGQARSWTFVWLKPESILLGQGVRASGETVGPGRLPLIAMVQRGLGKAGAIAISDSDVAVPSAAYIAMRRDMIQRVAGDPGDPRFHVTVRKDEGGGLLISADGIEPASEHGSEHFLDGEKLELRRLGAEGEDSKEIELAQNAPGHYETHVDAGGALSAVIVRKESAGRGGGESLVARVQSADVQSSEWPATVGASMIPQTGVVLSPALADAGMWNPAANRQMSLTEFWWSAAIVAVVAALFVRRG